MARQNTAGRNTRRPSRLAEVAYVRYRRWDSRYNTGGAILFRPHEFVIQTSCICASSVFASILLHMILRCESLHPILVIKKQNQVAILWSENRTFVLAVLRLFLITRDFNIRNNRLQYNSNTLSKESFKNCT